MVRTPAHAAAAGTGYARQRPNRDAPGNARSFGIWTPSSQDSCTKAQHDAFAVIGPDGRRYPTWHPSTGPGGCTFGHEHGRDPRRSALWETKQIQRAFYFDANGNGTMDSAEEAVSGIPFGYANEQFDLYNAAKGSSHSRHEDHIGHKIEWINGEPDLATHRMSAEPAGGAWVGALGDGVMQHDTGARCFYLVKVHQGVSTSDAFTNNLHEVIYLNDCRHPDQRYSQRVSVAQLVAFNRPGGFTKFMPLCGSRRRSDPKDFVELDLGSSAIPPSGFTGDREIVTRDCIEHGFLVPTGQWSENLYEAWAGSLAISRANGNRLASGIDLLFDVEDPVRYFYPQDMKARRGYANPAAAPNLGFSMDLCYDVSLAADGRLYRGGLCDAATDHRRIAGITWDDQRSAFRGLRRGAYVKPAILQNAGGPTVWYTDPLGGNASKTPFLGSIAQQLSDTNVNYSNLIGNRPIDPRVALRLHDDGGGSIHAPN
ncbi:MAG: hypothetical protein AB7N65_11775 [Vicinamibacterales bacterium]